MMKYLLSIVIILLCLTACSQPIDSGDTSGADTSSSSQTSATDEPEPTPNITPTPSEEESKDEVVENTVRNIPEGSVYGITFLGYRWDDYYDLPVELYLTEDEMNRLEVCLLDGDEYFLILPVSSTSYIHITPTSQSDGNNEVFYSQQNSPVLLRANISDIHTNSIVNIIDENIVAEFSPSVNLMDSTVNLDEGGYEIPTLSDREDNSTVIQTNMIDFRIPETWNDNYVIVDNETYVTVYFEDSVGSSSFEIILALSNTPNNSNYYVQVLDVYYTNYGDELFLLALLPLDRIYSNTANTLPYDRYNPELVPVIRSINNLLYSAEANDNFNIDVIHSSSPDIYLTLSMTLSQGFLLGKDIYSLGIEDINHEACEVVSLYSETEGDFGQYAISPTGTVYYFDEHDGYWKEYILLG